MSWMSDLAELRRSIGPAIESAIARIFVVTQFGKSSELGDDDAVESADQDAPGQREHGQRPATRTEPFGLRSRPTNKVRGVALRLGASNVIFFGILPTEGYGPQDLKDGETAVYSAKVERALHATDDGDVKLAAAAGRTVQVGGNTYALPKWDPFMTAFKAFLTTTKTATTAAQIAVAATTLDTAITADGTDFKSQLAKNG